MGNYKQAQKYYNDCYEGSTNAGFAYGLGTSLTNIALLHDLRGEFDQAIAKYEECLKLYEKIRSLRGSAIVLNNLGAVYSFLSNYKDASLKFKESFDLFSRIQYESGKRSILINLGGIYFKQGNFKEAVKHWELALDSARQEGDWQQEAGILNNLGLVFKAQLEFDKALQYYQQSYNIRKEKSDLSGQSESLNNIGALYAELGKFDDSLKNYQEAMTIEKDMDDKSGMATTYKNMGKTYVAMKDFEKSKDSFNKALALMSELGDNFGQGEVLSEIADAAFQQDKTSESLENVEKAIALQRETMDRQGLQKSLFIRAKCALKEGADSMAEQSLKESIDLIEALRQDLAGGEKETERYNEQKSQVYDAMVSLLVKQDKAEEALEYLDRSRSKNLQDQFSSLHIEITDSAKKAALDKENALKGELDALKKRLSDAEGTQNKELADTLQSRVEEKQQEYRKFIQQIFDEDPSLAHLFSVSPKNLKHKRTLLSPDMALIEYLVADKKLYIFLVTSKTLGVKEVDVPKEVVVDGVQFIRSIVSIPHFVFPIGSLNTDTLEPLDTARSQYSDIFMTPFKKKSADLYDLLITPIEQELSGINILCIIPNGSLHYLPFGLLGKSDSAGKFRFLMEDRDVLTLCDQSFVTFAQEKEKDVRAWQILSLGNADDSLKNAGDEANRIASLYAGSDAFLGKQATEDKVKTCAEKYNAIHFATHGVLDPKKIEDSKIVLAPNPASNEDGNLRLEEVWGLNLEGIRLVTLSACETAVGKKSAGDEIISLENAFVFSGAHTVIATLWPVDDEATGLLMEKFYTNLREHNKIDAMRLAQLELRSDPAYAHPFYWAPFIIVGDWR